MAGTATVSNTISRGDTETDRLPERRPQQPCPPQRPSPQLPERCSWHRVELDRDERVVRQDRETGVRRLISVLNVQAFCCARDHEVAGCFTRLSVDQHLNPTCAGEVPPLRLTGSFVCENHKPITHPDVLNRQRHQALGAAGDIAAPRRARLIHIGAVLAETASAMSGVHSVGLPSDKVCSSRGLSSVCGSHLPGRLYRSHRRVASLEARCPARNTLVHQRTTAQFAVGRQRAATEAQGQPRDMARGHAGTEERTHGEPPAAHERWPSRQAWMTTTVTLVSSLPREPLQRPTRGSTDFRGAVLSRRSEPELPSRCTARRARA